MNELNARPNIWAILIIAIISACSYTHGQLADNADYAPQVSATCKNGLMTVRVNFNHNFAGAVHAKDYRTPACMTTGNGSKSVQLELNMLASQKSPRFCGFLTNNKTEESSIPIAVRIHKTLELADDKFYVITCGKEGFKNASFVALNVLDDERKLHETYYGRKYTLRAQLATNNDSYRIRVKSCFAFNNIVNSSVPLIDERGCPVDPNIITEFKYDPNKGYADATIESMFKMSQSNEVHLQCDVVLCQNCPLNSCSFEQINPDAVLMAATSVFVLEPGQVPLLGESCDDGGRIRPYWLLWLCIAFGVLLLIMLIINIFLCTAMTCACTKTELIEKDPSIMEDYDPYRSWHGSQYGSRHSLSGGAKPNQGYFSGGGSTMNSTRSLSSHSDHYAVVNSRPGSRFVHAK